MFHAEFKTSMTIPVCLNEYPQWIDLNICRKVLLFIRSIMNQFSIILSFISYFVIVAFCRTYLVAEEL